MNPLHFRTGTLSGLVSWQSSQEISTRPDGHIVQIGDCDNGRFLKLHPSYDRMTLSFQRTSWIMAISHLPSAPY